MKLHEGRECEQYPVAKTTQLRTASTAESTCAMGYHPDDHARSAAAEDALARALRKHSTNATFAAKSRQNLWV